ncbi:hypothetical protein [Nostoc sp. NOS(2021)]|nr:hypothetical protein [Nostoc sp. NOS(2021)]
MKANLEPAFRDCLVKSLRLLMPNRGLPPQDLRQQPNEEHFQPGLETKF